MLPINTRRNPVRPWVEVMIRSTPAFLTYLSICSTADPIAIFISATPPLRKIASRSSSISRLAYSCWFAISVGTWCAVYLFPITYALTEIEWKSTTVAWNCSAKLSAYSSPRREASEKSSGTRILRN